MDNLDIFSFYSGGCTVLFSTLAVCFTWFFTKGLAVSDNRSGNCLSENYSLFRAVFNFLSSAFAAFVS